MSRPAIWSVEELRSADLGRAWVRALPRLRALAEERLDLPVLAPDAPVPAEAETLVVIGGGTLIDEAKLWRRDARPDLRLVAVPSLWGSGAEASPVVALTRDGAKHVELDPALVPDARVRWPELAAGLPEWRARDACGDAWSHALEAFFSPLADAPLQGELAAVVAEMLSLPLGNDPRWFEPSARACAAQARASVGLVHGIAHTLEGPLAGVDPEHPFGHARLCALFLWPVLAFDRQASPKLDELAAAHALDLEAVLDRARALHEPPAYEVALPVLEERWRAVLRDPCTRTNGALVRPDALGWFTGRRFA